MSDGPHPECIQASIERRWEAVAAIEKAFAEGRIDQSEWHRRMAALVGPAYLESADETGQSGYDGSLEQWRDARQIIADTIERDSSFLDIGCANGLLMESVHAWCAERGVEVEPFGLEIVPELAALARRRLPRWSSHIFEGNAAAWKPGRRFSVVRCGLEYVPTSRRAHLIEHLLASVVDERGSLLIGPFSEPLGSVSSESTFEQVQAFGFGELDCVEREHERDRRLIRRLLVLNAAS